MEPTEEELKKKEEAEAQRLVQLEKQAQKHIRKHKREINRLKREAELALYQNNFIKYKYAIGKLRRIYKQPYTESLLADLFITSRESVLELVKKAMDENK